MSIDRNFACSSHKFPLTKTTQSKTPHSQSCSMEGLPTLSRVSYTANRDERGDSTSEHRKSQSRTWCVAREIVDSPAAEFSMWLMDRKARHDRGTHLRDALQRGTRNSPVWNQKALPLPQLFTLPMVIFSSIVARRYICVWINKGLCS